MGPSVFTPSWLGALTLLVSHAASAPTGAEADTFLAWKAKYNKVYPSADAEERAREAFHMADEYIRSHAVLSWTLAHNEFSDQRPESRVFGLRRSTSKGNTTSMPPVFAAQVAVEQRSGLPAEVDWVAKGAVGPVQNQGRCGSCWAFSAAGAIEAALFIGHGSLHTLSAEELVQCDSQSQGCKAGSQVAAFEFVRDHGIVADEAYPYTSGGGTTGECDAAREGVEIVAKLDGHQVITDDGSSNLEARIMAAVAQQPVAVGMFAQWDGFQHYNSGVISAAQASDCLGQTIDHGVLVVGYGTDDASGLDYWKVKNQWGATWGDSGYFKIERGQNVCGIESDVSYPTGVRPYSTKPSPPMPPSSPPSPTPAADFWTHIKEWLTDRANEYFNWFRGLPGVKKLDDKHDLQVAIAAIAFSLAIFIALSVLRCVWRCFCGAKRRRRANREMANVVTVQYGAPLLDGPQSALHDQYAGQGYAQSGYSFRSDLPVGAAVPVGTAVPATAQRARQQ